MWSRCAVLPWFELQSPPAQPARPLVAFARRRNRPGWVTHFQSGELPRHARWPQRAKPPVQVSHILCNGIKRYPMPHAPVPRWDQAHAPIGLWLPAPWPAYNSRTEWLHFLQTPAGWDVNRLFSSSPVRDARPLPQLSRRCDHRLAPPAYHKN